MESGKPKTAQVEEKTNLETLCARQASRSVSVEQVLFRKYFPGCSMDSPTSAKAAKCMTASKRFVEKIPDRQSRSPVSPTISGTPSATELRWPRERLSRTVTW